MARLQVAIVLPSAWHLGIRGLVDPIWPEELACVLDEIEDAYPQFEIYRMFEGTFAYQSCRIKLRLYVAESGDIIPLSDASIPMGVDVDRARDSGLWKTLEEAMRAYSRKYHQTD